MTWHTKSSILTGCLLGLELSLGLFYDASVFCETDLELSDVLSVLSLLFGECCEDEHGSDADVEGVVVLSRLLS